MMSDYTGLRKRFYSNDVLINALMGIPDPTVGRILGRSGVDFVTLDIEHSPFTASSLRSCVEAIASTPASCVVRVGSIDEATIKQVLDLGVGGIQFANIRTPEQAALAVKWSKFPPLGNRGFGFGRASEFGTDGLRFSREANDETVILAMIESGEGAQNATQILSVDGIDALVVGPMDLAMDLGVPLDEPRHEQILAAFERVLDAGRATGKRVCVGGSPSETGYWLERGASLFMHAVDTLILNSGVGATVAQARSQM
jgi:4-hydroxy-2-oxoheptanedioate aldolase